MSLSATHPLTPGGCFTFWAEHATRPDLAHTVAEVCVLGQDPRDPREPWVLYLVQQPDGKTPVLAACTAMGFRQACSPSRQRPWVDQAALGEGSAWVAQVITASPEPGVYTFTREA